MHEHDDGFASRCEEGDLHKMIQEKRKFSVQEKLMMAADVAAGLQIDSSWTCDLPEKSSFARTLTRVRKHVCNIDDGSFPSYLSNL